MLAYIISLAINILIALIFVRALLSWFPDFARKYPDISNSLNNITDPLLKPFERLIPPQRTGGIDLSPVLAIIALSVIRSLIMMIL